ncbi:MAG: hypothetical protein ABSB15_21135, partial [Bryobacteraceae bacterium]
MAVYIEQTPDQVKRSFSVQRRAEIIDVRLCRAFIESDSRARDFEEITVSLGHKSTSVSVEDGLLRTEIEFALTAVPENDESIKVLSLQCEFRVTYQLEKGYEPTPEEANAFSAANAIFNAWPYFRELTQNLSARMSLPSSPVIPFLKLVPKKEEKDQH